ncbi:hypothetical protein Tco_0196781 [Tanacetum coccineum]
MDNLPDSWYVDYAAGSSSSSNVSPPNNAGATSALSAAERSKIGRLIQLVNLPHTRSETITQLNNIFKDNKDGTTRGLADQVLHNINTGPQVQYVGLENAFAGMRL